MYQAVLWHGRVVLPSKLVPLCFLMMNCDVYRDLNICVDAAKCLKTHWAVLHTADWQWPETYYKARLFQVSKVECTAVAKLMTWPESNWACILFAEGKNEDKISQEQARAVTDAVKTWQSITKETQHLVMSMSSRPQAVIDCKGPATKYVFIKYNLFRILFTVKKEKKKKAIYFCSSWPAVWVSGVNFSSKSGSMVKVRRLCVQISEVAPVSRTLNLQLNWILLAYEFFYITSRYYRTLSFYMY